MTPTPAHRGTVTIRPAAEVRRDLLRDEAVARAAAGTLGAELSSVLDLVDSPLTDAVTDLIARRRDDSWQRWVGLAPLPRSTGLDEVLAAHHLATGTGVGADRLLGALLWLAPPTPSAIAAACSNLAGLFARLSSRPDALEVFCGLAPTWDGTADGLVEAAIALAG